MKQTAVEWLIEKIQQAKPTFKFDALIREAIKMEKQQIIDAANSENSVDINHGEQYYNETFKNK